MSEDVDRDDEHGRILALLDALAGLFLAQIEHHQTQAAICRRAVELIRSAIREGQRDGVRI